MERPLQLNFYSKVIAKKEIGGRLPKTVKYKIRYGGMELVTITEGSLLSQYYSHYLFYIELFEIRLQKRVEISFNVLEPTLFLFLMLDGSIGFSTQEGSLVAEAFAGMCYAAFSVQTSFFAPLFKGVHRLLYITFSSGWINKHLNEFPLLNTMVNEMNAGNSHYGHLPPCLISRQMMKTILKLFTINPSDSVIIETQITGCSMRLLVDYLRMLEKGQQIKYRSKKTVANEIKAYLEQNLSDTQAGNILKLSETFYMSERTLMRIFQQETGMKVHEFLLKIRMKHALDLLTTTRLTVSSVALNCGYQYSHTFSKAFKRYFGKLPNAVRRHDSGRLNHSK